MTRDLWDFLPPAKIEGNYATRKVYQWIACDATVNGLCRQCAQECFEEDEEEHHRHNDDHEVILALRVAMNRS